MTSRNPGIELLRCVAMLAIILGHCCIFSCVGDTRVARLIVTGTMFSVNSFIFISGYYGINFSWSKARHLLWIATYASLVLFLLSPVVGSWNYRLSLGWFGLSYFALMTLAPLVNTGVRKLKDGKLLETWTAYSIVMIINWMPSTFFGLDFHIPGWTGCSFLSMLYVYFTGRVVRETNSLDSISTKGALSAVLLLSFLNLLGAVLAGITKGKLINLLFVGTRDNNSPLIILLGLSAFAFFRGIKLHNVIVKISEWISPSVFGIYLLHEGCNPEVSRALYSKGIESLSRYVDITHGGGY